MAETLKLGNGDWATKEGSLLAYSNENGNYKPLPFDVTRASSATVVNKQGLIETVQSGVPRIDFSDDTNGALLSEPQSTNFITESEDYTKNYWSKLNTVITANATDSPDGTINASLLVGTNPSTTGTYIRAASTSASTIGTTYTLSLYVKPKGSSKFFKFWARNTDVGSVLFNLVDGTTDSPATSTITNAGNGWFRVTTTGELVSGTVAPYFYTFYSATESEGFYFWGAQIEALSYATSYIPTSGGLTSTRLADVVSVGTAGLGITSITETINGVDQVPIDVIPAIYTVPIYTFGAEKINNGDFATDTKWTTNTGWNIGGGSANCDGTQGGNTTLVQQNGIKGAIIDFVVGKIYKVNFDIIVTSGQISNIEVASSYDSNPIAISGNHTTYITAVSTNDRFTITANPNFIGSIDNVSVKEALDGTIKINKIVMI